MIIGRGTVQEAVGDVLTAARDGHGRALLLSGPAGSGRTSLLEQAAADADHCHVLRISGVAEEQDIAYSGLQELLAPVLGYLDDIPQVQATALRGALALAEAKGSDRLAVGAGVLSLLSVAARERAVLCLVDDVDLVDQASVETLIFVTRRLGHDSVGMVLTVETSREQTLAAPGLVTLSLQPLDATASRAVLLQRYPELVASVSEQLVQVGAGVPGWLLDIAGQLTEGQRRGTSPLPMPLPASGALAKTVLERYAELSVPGQRATLAAAAAGTQTMRVITSADPTLLDGLHEAEEQGLVEIDGGRVQIQPTGAASAIYHHASAAERRRLSRLFAQALKGDPKYRDLRAWHLTAASGEPDAELADQLEAAADETRLLRGEAAAVSLYELAGRLSEDPARRDARTCSAAESAWLAGQTWRATQLVGQIAATPDGSATHARATFLRACLDERNGRLAVWAQALEATATAVSDCDDVLKRRLLSAAIRACDPSRRPRLVKAFAVTTTPDDLGGQLWWQLVELLSAQSQNDPKPQAEAAHQLARIDVETAVSALDPLSLGEVAALGAAVVEAQPTAVDAVLLAVAVEAQKRAIVWLPLSLRLRADYLLASGHWSDAAVAYQDSRQLAEELDQPVVVRSAAAGEATMAALQGREDLGECLDRLGSPDAVAGQAVRGLDELARGRPKQALAHWGRSSPSDLCRVLPGGSLTPVDWIDATARSEGRPAAAQSLAAVAPLLAADEALASWAAALVAEQDYDADFAAALRSFDTSMSPRPYSAARLHLHWGERLQRDGQRRAAREHLRAAHEVFERLGAQSWDALACRELKATGETPRRHRAAGFDELTPRELQVAELIASGATYKEVAGQVYLDVKTIEFHMSHVYRKLGITSRRELPGRLAEGAGQA